MNHSPVRKQLPKKEVEYDSQLLELLIGAATGVVLVFVVKVELEMFANWEKAARI